jgi:hypothetical protein
MKRKAGLFLVAMIASSLTPVLAAGRPCNELRPCHEHPRLEGPCFTVRGRMNFWNGTPSVRIWVVGTNRIIGVSVSFDDPAYCSLPDEILEKLSWESDLFADFVVCPFTVEKPGVMRLICVESAKNMVVRTRE